MRQNVNDEADQIARITAAVREQLGAREDAVERREKALKAAEDAVVRARELMVAALTDTGHPHLANVVSLQITQLQAK